MKISFPETSGHALFGNGRFMIKRNIFSTRVKGVARQGLFVKGTISDEGNSYPALFFVSEEVLEDVLGVDVFQSDSIIEFAELNPRVFKNCALERVRSSLTPDLVVDAHRGETNFYDMSETLAKSVTSY